MIHIKKPFEIAKMEKAGKMLAEVLAEVVAAVKPGITEIELDALAEKLILEKGGEPGFKKVEGYKHTICVATNEVVVHGIPGKRVLKDGDIIGIDCGVYLGGFHTDMAETVRVSSLSSRAKREIPEISPEINSDRNDKEDEVDRFLATGKKALLAGIEAVRPGNRVGHISKAIQGIVEGQGYSVVRSLIGHGVGKELHEDPEIPGYLDRRIENTPLLVPGMTIAVEVIYNQGSPEVIYSGEDDWTIVTADGSLGGLFERTVLVTPEGHRVLTPMA